MNKKCVKISAFIIALIMMLTISPLTGSILPGAVKADAATKKVWLCTKMKTSGGYIYKFSYDSKGNLVKYEDCSYDDSRDYKYDKNNNLITLSSLYDDEKYKYDSKNNLVNLIFDQNDKMTYSYDKNGYVSSDKYESDDYYRNVKYKRDKSGKIIEEQITTQSNKSVNKISYKYDKNGNLTQKRSDWQGDNYRLWKYSYDKNNRITKIYWEAPDYSSERIYKYDKNGNISEMTYRSGDLGSECYDTFYTCYYTYKQVDLECAEEINVGGGYKILLLNNSFKYNGKAVRPQVSVVPVSTYDITPRMLLQGRDYVITYSNNEKVGKGKITIQFDNGYEYLGSHTFTFTIKPDAPKNLKVKSSTANTVTLSWDSAAGAEKYVVYKTTDGKNWKKAAETSKTSVTVKKLSPNTKYKFKIVAADKSVGIKSSASKSISVRTKKK